MSRLAKGTAALAFLLIASVRPASAQQSAAYDLREHVLNAGGHPLAGMGPASAGYRVSLDAIGSPASLVASASFRLSGGFVAAYPPPGEVTGLRFGPDAIGLTWDAEPAAGTYQVYRGPIPGLPGGGVCSQGGLVAPLASEAQAPATGAGYFYLVTSRNSLGEEGTKGFASNGVERLNSLPCP